MTALVKGGVEGGQHEREGSTGARGKMKRTVERLG